MIADAAPTPSSRRGRAAWALALVAALALACQPSVDERLARARELQGLGALDQAVESLREILKQHPEHPEANLLLGLTQLGLLQPSLAIWPLQIASKSPQQALRANLGLAAAYLHLDQNEQALAAVDQVLAAEPDDIDQLRAALQLRAGIHMALEQWDEAIADANRLLGVDPENPQALTTRAFAQVAQGKPEDAEKTLREIWTQFAENDPVAAVRGGLGLVRLYDDQLKSPARAERQMEEVLTRFPASLEALDYAEGFYERRKTPERADEVLRKAVAQEPADLRLRSRLAERLAERGKVAEGEAVLVEATDLLGTPEAWITLAEYRRLQGDYAKALEALERTIELVPAGLDTLSFKHAGVLADAGQLDRAEEVAKTISQAEYRDLILGRIAYLRGDSERALELLDRGLRRWPNNAGGRYLAGRAALDLGRLDRAIAELREAVRADPVGTDAAIDLARIQLARHHPAAALEYVGRAATRPDAYKHPERLREMLVLMIRSQGEIGMIDEAKGNLLQLAKLPGGALPAVVESAALAARLEGAQTAARSIERSSLDLRDPKNETALRALCQYLVEIRRPGDALARVDAALAAHPESAPFHDIRGRVLAQTGRTDDARAAFEKAIALDDRYAPALHGLAQLAAAQGDDPRALELLDRAAAADPRSATFPYEAAQIELAAGRTQQARERLESALRRDPWHAHASNDLAWILAEEGRDLDRAAVLAQRAVEGDPSAGVLDTLGWVQFKRGEHAEAVASLEKAHELDPASPSISYRLSLALLKTGEDERARALLREAVATGGFPEAERAREELAQLERAGS